MTKAEAREYALRVLAAEIRHHVPNGSEWLFRPLSADQIHVQEDGDFSGGDYKRICEAVEEIADDLERRSRRLALSRLTREARALRRKLQRGAP
jgi:hypothetical protein